MTTGRPPRKSLPGLLLDDIRSAGLRSTIRRDVGDLYDYYIDEEEKAELASMRKGKRFFAVTARLFVSLMRKLTPARRLMFFTGLLLGVLGEIDVSTSGRHFTIDVRIWGVLLLVAVVMLELKDKLLARDEIEVARGVQLALLPSEAPPLPGFEIWGATLPANDVGGDLLDYLPLPEQRLAAALGDVAGKGMGAALLMAKLQATLRALTPLSSDLGDLGARLNTIFCRDGLDNRFATLFHLVLEAGSGEVRYLNAGHNPPLVLGRDGVSQMDGSSRPIGMLRDSTYAEHRLEMAPGDLLVVYSDGLTEARDPDGAEFGLERLRGLLPPLRDLPIGRVGDRVLAEVDRFARGARRHDDQSLLLVRRAVVQGAANS